MAAISHVFTIRRAAQILGRDEDLLWELSDQLEPEDGKLWVCDIDGAETPRLHPRWHRGSSRNYQGSDRSRRLISRRVYRGAQRMLTVHQHAASIARNKKQSMGRSRGGLTSKIHAVVDTNGLPVRLALTAGEAHDNRLAGRLLSRLKSGTMLLADRGYDADWIRELASKRGVWANIPPRCNRNEPICFSPCLYATRYDKLAANYLAFIQLASIR